MARYAAQVATRFPRAYECFQRIAAMLQSQDGVHTKITPVNDLLGVARWHMEYLATNYPGLPDPDEVDWSLRRLELRVCWMRGNDRLILLINESEWLWLRGPRGSLLNRMKSHVPPHPWLEDFA